MYKTFLNNIKKFYKQNKAEFFILAAILLVAAFFRLYNIAGYMTFLGDEGRDVIIVRRFLTELHPPLIGPGTSIGNMYLGPFYYYFMAPGLLLANFSPIGPALQIAILGIFTVWFVWYTTRIWFNKTAAIVAAILYAISPTVIIYSRSSWNPNIMPFFSLLAVFAIWKVFSEKKFNWLMVAGFSFAAVLQSHYLGLLLAPTLGVFYLWTFVKIRKKSKSENEMKDFAKKSVWALVIFLGMMSPLLMFDARHGWINTKAMYSFFTVRQTTVSIRPWTALPKIPQSLEIVSTSLLGAKDKIGGKVAYSLMLISVAALIVNLINVYRRFKSNKKLDNEIPALILLAVWLTFALVGFGLYKQNIYDHYYGFIFPVPFMVAGLILSTLTKFKTVGKAAGALILIYFIAVNLINSPLKQTPGNQMTRARNVADKIKTESKGERFNLGVIAERNYEDGYRYFLLKDGLPVVNIDSQIKDSITSQLFAVCELPREKCDPTHNATASIANFGWSKAVENWEVDGVIIYKLVHTEKQ